MINNKFKGIWISPNGDVYETDNIQSHRLVIKELNMENTLMNFSKTYKWSKEELKLNYNNDISYIAMIYGFIRITSIYNQIGIEYYRNIKRCQFEEIINFIRKNENIEGIQIMIEILSENRYVVSNIFDVNKILQTYII